MAEEKRSIEISYKANLKDLIGKLKTLPNITGQEAKKMVAQLDRQLKQAEGAAKKATESQKKAAKAAGDAFKRNAGAIKGVTGAADQASEKLGHVADSAGEVDRGFAAVALALGQVNPALGEAANLAADFAAVSEGLLLTIKNLNPVLLVGAAAIGILTLGLADYFAAAEKAKQITIAMREAQKSSNLESKDLQERLALVTAKYREYKQSLDITTGAIDKNKAAMILAEKEVRASFSGHISIQESHLANLQEREKLLKRVFNEDRAISDEEKETLRTLQLQNSNIDNNLDLTIRNAKELTTVGHLWNNIKDEVEQSERALNGIKRAQSESVGLAKLEAQYKLEQAAEEKRISDAKEKQNGLNDQLKLSDQEALDLAKQKQLEAEALANSQDRLFKLTHDGHQNDIKGINDSSDALREKAKLEFDLHQEKGLYVANLHAIQKENIGELSELEEKLSQQKINDSMKLANAYIRVFDQATQSTAEYLQNTGKMTEESAQALFRLQQLLSVAKIAMLTAEGIHKATLMGPVAGAIYGGLVTASGIAQTAMVMTQQQPTLHMGGMGPDEQTRVLKGEAVLDRTTTRRLGEDGVRRLQNQSTNQQDNVVILQPFKHIDRYNRSAQKRRGRPVGSGGY